MNRQYCTVVCLLVSDQLSQRVRLTYRRSVLRQVIDQRVGGLEYVEAERKCAMHGSFVAADRDGRQADYLPALMTAMNYTSYWVGLSSDEEDETTLSYPDWVAFDEAQYSRFGSSPAMAAPACTMVSAEDGFAKWNETSCEKKNHVLCEYHGTKRHCR